MPTIFTVGAGGTHATLQAAWDAIPSVLADQYIIRLKHQEFVTTGSASVLNISGRTTTPTFNIIIEAEPGASWKDDSNVRTNPYRYDPARGAAIRSADASIITFSGTVNDLTIRGIQAKQQAGALSSFDCIKCLPGWSSTNLVIQDCIVEQSGSDNNDVFFLLGASKLSNCLIIHGGNNPDSAIKLSDTAAGLTSIVTGCTVVRPSNLSPGGIGLNNKFPDNTFIAKDNVSMNFATDGANLTPGSDYNGTSQALGASSFPNSGHNTYSIPHDVTTFEQPSQASGLADFRPKRGSLLENTGILDLTNSPADAIGLTRGNPPDLGAREIEALNSIAIDDRTFELPHFGRTQHGVRLDPIVVGDDFRLKRTYTGLTTGALIVSAEFTVKLSLRDADNLALIRKQITTAVISAGQITDADVAGGSIAMYFEAFSAETALAKFETKYPYYIKVRTSTGQTHTLETGFIPFVRS